MDQQRRQALALAITLLLLIGLGAGFGELAKNSPNTSSFSTTATQESVAPISYEGQDGKTVLELLQSKYSIQTKDSSYGTYVSSINGKAGDADSAWLYYIDGQLGQDSADKAVTKNGQKVEWRYESF